MGAPWARAGEHALAPNPCADTPPEATTRGLPITKPDNAFSDASMRF